MKTTTRLSALALLVIFCLSMFVVLAPKAQAATVPAVVSSSVNEGSSSITLPGGADIYLYGYGTGGSHPSGDFAYGEYTSLTNQGGNVVAALAVSTSYNNYFSTSSHYPVIGGAGVQDFSSYSSSFGTNNSPAAPSASDSFTVTISGSLIVVIAIGGDEQSLSVSGLPSLQIDAAWPGSPSNALEILHTYLDAGTYVVTEYTSQSAGGQTPAYAGDLIGVFVFSPSASGNPSSTSVTCSPNPVSIGSSVTCKAVVSGSNATGTVTWSTSSSTGQFGTTSVSLVSGSCSVTYIDSNVAPVTITAEYSGDSNNAPSNGEATLTITPVDSATSCSIFWITDTQHLANPTLPGYDSQKLVGLTNWIVNNAKNYNAQMVVHTGDLVDDGLDNTEWAVANASMYKLMENNIPYCWCAGNHDDKYFDDPLSGWIGNNFTDSSGTYSSNTAFNPSVVSAKEPGNWVNVNNGEYAAVANGEDTAVKFNFGGLSFLVINIEFCAHQTSSDSSSSVFPWVSGLLKEYSKSNVIIATHDYMNSSGDTTYPDQDPERIDNVHSFCVDLNNLLKQYPNVFLTLNGHFDTPSGYFATAESNTNLNKLMFDRQDRETVNKFPTGAESVTVLTFDIGNSQMEVRTCDLNQNNGKGAFLSSPFNPYPSIYEDAFTLTLPLSLVWPLYSVVRGLDDRIYYGDWMVLPGSTIDSPAAAMLGNELHIVVRGSDGDSLWYGHLTDPADLGSFSGWTLLSGATNSAPTLTSNGTALCLVVRGLDNRVYYCCYSEGVWEQWYAVPTGATPDAPAAAMLGNDLHIAVRGMDGFSLWDTIVSCDGTVIRGWNLVSGATPSKPVLACSGLDSLCLVVEGMDNAIYYRSYTGSTDSWGDWSAFPTGATNDGPGATVMGDTLCTVVRGMDGNSIWCGETDLATNNFLGWTLLSGATPSPPTLTS